MCSDTFIPLSIPSLKGNELNYVTECIETGWVSSVGAYVSRFEREIAAFLGVEYAVACMNGTAAIHTALLLSNVGFEDEVIVPTLTFIAPVNAVRYVGAFPVFMDCDDYLNLDVDKLADFLKNCCRMTTAGLVNTASGRHVKAIIVVHVFGHPALLESIMCLAREYNLKVIEDATEALGSFYKMAGSRRYAGTMGDIGCLSFNGNKLITTGGGGMLLTSNKRSSDFARHLTTQAKLDPIYFTHDEVGYNYRMTNLQAAMGVAQLEKVNEFLAIKRRNYYRYKEALADLENTFMVDEPSYAVSNYWYYSFVIERPRSFEVREHLMQSLRAKRIETRPVWALVHRQKPYRSCEAFKIEKALQYEQKVLNLPCSVTLREEEINKVVDVIKEIL